MKRIIRVFVIETVILYLVSRIATGMVFEQGLRSIVIAGGALSVASMFIKPIINLLLLPLNMITFGLFRWISHAIMLFLVDLVLPEYAITGFEFGGYFSTLIEIPAITLSGGPLAYIAFSFLISFVTSIIYWLVK